MKPKIYYPTLEEWKQAGKPINCIVCCDCLEALELPDDYVDCIITSPPYWGLRDYGEETNTIWGGDPDCKHEWEVKETRRPNASGGKTDYAKQKLAVKGTENYSEFVDYHNRVTKSSFCKKCGAWYGQLGLEPTLDLYIEHLLQITAELKRVLKKTGVMFWNHGDSYSGNMGKRSGWSYVSGITNIDNEEAVKRGISLNSFRAKYILPQKCLCLQNFRLIMRMIDEQGWILRNVIVWHKPNHMPSSVKDRFTNAYEPVFMLVKNKKYWFDLDAVRVPQKEFINKPNQKPKAINKGTHLETGAFSKKGGFNTYREQKGIQYNPLGKNPGDIWTIPTQPFPEAHFATYPEKLIEPMIKAGCPQWICKKCGKARERITRKKLVVHKEYKDKGKAHQNVASGSKEMPAIPRARTGLEGHNEYQTIGWTDCGCKVEGEKWKAGIVLDPFFGSGTTGFVARKLGRNFLGFEINPEYCEIAKKRLIKIPEKLDKFVKLQLKD